MYQLDQEERDRDSEAVKLLWERPDFSRPRARGTRARTQIAPPRAAQRAWSRFHRSRLVLALFRLRSLVPVLARPVHAIEPGMG